MSFIYNILAALFCSLLFCLPAFTQTNEQTNARLEAFLEESTETIVEEINSTVLEQILKYKVYSITRKTKNTFDSTKTHNDTFIVMDTGEKIIHFEQIHKAKSLSEFLSFIKEDFILDPETAPLFEDMLDIMYPIADWKIDKREIIHKNGKWYFLRDAYFRTKQGFEITLDSSGKITAIRYKMKWDEPDGS